jgi:predicted dehydrogenase
MEVYGSTGYDITVESDRLRTRRAGERTERTETAPALPSDRKDSLSYLVAVLTGKLNPHGDLTALDTNVTVMRILDAARESAKTGQSVRLRPPSDTE